MEDSWYFVFAFFHLFFLAKLIDAHYRKCVNEIYKGINESPMSSPFRHITKNLLAYFLSLFQCVLLNIINISFYLLPRSLRAKIKWFLDLLFSCFSSLTNCMINNCYCKHRLKNYDFHPFHKAIVISIPSLSQSLHLGLNITDHRL